MTTERPEPNTSAGDSDDAELLRSIAGRDRHAFEQLYRRYRPRLKRFIATVPYFRDLIEEVIDDVMFTIWTDAARFQGQSKVSTWIFAIAYRKALKMSRRESLRRSILVDDTDAAALRAVNPAPDFPERLANHAWLRAALETLSPEQQLAIELTFFEGLSYAEIAEIAGCSVNTVKTRMFHARRKLRAILDGK